MRCIQSANSSGRLLRIKLQQTNAEIIFILLSLLLLGGPHEIGGRVPVHVVAMHTTVTVVTRGKVVVVMVTAETTQHVVIHIEAVDGKYLLFYLNVIYYLRLILFEYII